MKKIEMYTYINDLKNKKKCETNILKTIKMWSLVVWKKMGRTGRIRTLKPSLLEIDWGCNFLLGV